MILEDPRPEHTAAIIAINQLADAYADAICRGDHHAAAQVYAPDGVLVSPDGGEVRGRAAIEQAIDGGTSRLSMVYHMVHGRLVHVTGDEATARFQISEWSRRTEDDKAFFYLGFYEDDLVRLAEGWRFSRRHLVSRTIVHADFFAGRSLPIDGLRPQL